MQRDRTEDQISTHNNKNGMEMDSKKKKKQKNKKMGGDEKNRNAAG